MKRFIVICDGMADIPDSGGITPLEAARTPYMDRLAAEGRSGLISTVPPGYYPGSETAILSILGYPANELPKGRGPLEASGLNLRLPSDNCQVGRYIINHHYIDAPHFPDSLHPDVLFFPFSPTSGLALHKEGYPLPPSSDKIKFWSIDTPKTYPTFFSLHSNLKPGSKGIIIGAVPLLKGIAKETGLDWHSPEGCDGTPSTLFAAKGHAAVEAAVSHDVIIIHIEACDYASHHFDLPGKIRSIENIDGQIVRPVYDYALQSEESVSISVMSDHPSLCSTGEHSVSPPPFLLWHKDIKPDMCRDFSEKEAMTGNLKSISEIYE